MRVTQEVVHSVSIHLTADEFTPEKSLPGRAGALNQRGDIIRSEAIVRVPWMLLDDVLKLCANNRGRVVLV